ncbi:MAG: histidine--tRNA ligase [Francisellaceae bacterium]|nr:histidine--tRNA ligase [Francisellaceae bacterium]MBT6206476.1 histidine--tRNA ligase [Francisellaceae bacterium]MBT6539192.1 histidine--tRNA ligase [Francisellaceae bacterium]
MGLVYKSIKGMPDLLPEAMDIWHIVEDKIRTVMHSYSYSEIRTPVLEKTELFKRSIGEVTDIVEKEMYSFVDRDKHDTNITLRPEGTAGCVRAVLESSMIRNNQQQRLWYMGPMYRRERPQKGRYRQFYQFGIEFFSVPTVDAEIEQIQIAYDIFNSLGLLNFVSLEINSLGGKESRARFTKKLVLYFENHLDELDEDSKRRLTNNPLRILDSKVSSMIAIIDNAPKLIDFLSEQETSDLEQVKKGLDTLGIPYKLNPKIVRGLDYYQGLVYEWVTDKLGSQSAICAGGRYDNLIEQLGGNPGHGVGFAMGIERVIALLEFVDNTNVKNNAFLFTVGDIDISKVHVLVGKIRASCPQIEIWVNWTKASVGTQMKKAHKHEARWAMLIGEQELDNMTVTIKSMHDNGPQQEVSVEELAKILNI